MVKNNNFTKRLALNVQFKGNFVQVQIQNKSTGQIKLECISIDDLLGPATDEVVEVSDTDEVEESRPEDSKEAE